MVTVVTVVPVVPLVPVVAVLPLVHMSPVVPVVHVIPVVPVEHLVDNRFSCPEFKENFGSKSVLNKHKNKYHVYNNILEDFSDIPFKLSD